VLTNPADVRISLLATERYLSIFSTTRFEFPVARPTSPAPDLPSATPDPVAAASWLDLWYNETAVKMPRAAATA